MTGQCDGSLLYVVPIFTFWQDQVNKGMMPEPDMSSNYIGLYKTHDNTFQIMLTPKPKTNTKEEIKYKDIKLNIIKNNLFPKRVFSDC